MEPKKWKRLKKTVEKAIQLPEEDRASFLDEYCGSDPELRSEVDSLLRHHSVSNPLDVPALIHAAELFREPPPEMVGDCLVIRLIGGGASADVYLAQRIVESSIVQVAAKVFRTELYGKQELKRFETERRILASLNHRNIVRLLDGGILNDGRPYLILELVDGPPVTLFAEAKQLNQSQRLRLFQSVCEGVAYAHGRAVVHRDLKPSNILATADGTPKLLDFGVAGLPPAAGIQPKDSMRRYATRAYSSPEQLRGDVPGPASDVYSLGLILCELISGSRSRSVSGLPAQVGDIAARCLEPNPEERYADASELLRALEGLE